VIYVNASEKVAGGGYHNRRAEIYDTGARAFEDGLVQIDPGHKELSEELSWAKQKVTSSSGNVFLVESKVDIKKEFLRSPDHADAFLNGLWALPRVRPVGMGDAYSGGRSGTGRRNAATA
jgi:hypothetical protein